MHGTIFPSDSQRRRILIFGNSKVLAGFVPTEFDTLESENGVKTFSFNSGYPAISTFIPELKRMVGVGQIPDVLLLTVPWRAAPPRSTLLHFAPDDHAIAETLFPFRHLPRDAFSFLLTAGRHGGVLRFYEESERNVDRMLKDQGYYFISEQSQFKGDRLPDNFHLASDNPAWIQGRSADVNSPELSELKAILTQHRIDCYFVPTYFRIGEFASAPRNEGFAKQVESNSSCKVLGPDYLLFPNSYFSDQTHLNRIGASEYTKKLYELLAAKLR